MQEVPTNLNTLHSLDIQVILFSSGSNPRQKKRLTEQPHLRCRFQVPLVSIMALELILFESKKSSVSAGYFCFQQSWDQKIKGWLEIHEISILYRGLFCKNIGAFGF